MRERLSPEERRKQLLTVAAACFHEKGYTETTVSELVKRAGVAKGTFFYYFPTKESILTALIEQECEQGMARWISNTKGESALNQLQEFTNLIDEKWSSDDIIDRLYESGDIRLVEHLWRFVQNYFKGTLVDCIKQGVQEGSMHVKNIELAVTYIWAVLDGYYRYGEEYDGDILGGENKHMVNDLIYHILGVQQST